MTATLTPAQRALLREEPLLPGHKNKLDRAAQLANVKNLETLADALGFSLPQLSRYRNNEDLLLSTAFRIAEFYGVDVCDLWPVAPKSQRRRKPPVKAKRGRKTNGPKAQVAA